MTVPAELARIMEQLEQAKTPEDVFGSDPDAMHTVYRRLSRVVHPDKYANMQVDAETIAAADGAFKCLSDWLKQAEGKQGRGTYGSVTPEIVIRSKQGEYHVGEIAYQGDIANLYRSDQGLVKVARSPIDNDLLKNEAAMLKRLSAAPGADVMQPWFPKLVDSFTYEDDSHTVRQANVLSYGGSERWYTLKEVKAAYPNGIDPKDMAWIFRRALAFFAFTHGEYVLHGAALPPHILIQPEEHGFLMIDWCYAVYDENSEPAVQALVPEYKDWYTKDVLAKKGFSPSQDTMMLAGSMNDLLGGTYLSAPSTVPVTLRTFLRGCQLNSVPSAQDLLAEFDERIQILWGARKFHPFTMPS